MNICSLLNLNLLKVLDLQKQHFHCFPFLYRRKTPEVRDIQPAGGEICA